MVITTQRSNPVDCRVDRATRIGSAEIGVVYLDNSDRRSNAEHKGSHHAVDGHNAFSVKSGGIRDKRANPEGIRADREVAETGNHIQHPLSTDRTLPTISLRNDLNIQRASAISSTLRTLTDTVRDGDTKMLSKLRERRLRGVWPRKNETQKKHTKSCRVTRGEMDRKLSRRGMDRKLSRRGMNRKLSRRGMDRKLPRRGMNRKLPPRKSSHPPNGPTSVIWTR